MLLKGERHMKIDRITMTGAVVLAGVFGITQSPLAQTPGPTTTRCVPADQVARSGAAPGSTTGTTPNSGATSGSTTPGSSSTAQSGSSSTTNSGSSSTTQSGSSSTTQPG